MSRKKLFDSFIEKAVEGSILVGEEGSWKEIISKYFLRLDGGRLEEGGGSRERFLEDLKRLLVIRIRRQFEKVAEDLRRGVYLIEDLLDRILKSGRVSNDLNFFDRVWEEFGKVLEGESEIAYHLFVIYQEARRDAEKNGKGKDYVKKVMKQYAEDFFNKLYISMESIAKFCEAIEKVYDKIEEAKEQVQKRQAQKKQGQGQGQSQSQGEILVFLRKHALNNAVMFSLAKRLVSLLDEREGQETNKRKGESKKKSSKIKKKSSKMVM